jgi:hypothetical protein
MPIRVRGRETVLRDGMSAIENRAEEHQEVDSGGNERIAPIVCVRGGRDKAGLVLGLRLDIGLRSSVAPSAKKWISFHLRVLHTPTPCRRWIAFHLRVLHTPHTQPHMDCIALASFTHTLPNPARRYSDLGENRSLIHVAQETRSIRRRDVFSRAGERD